MGIQNEAMLLECNGGICLINKESYFLTKKLMLALVKIEEQYSEARETKKMYDFYTEIEPFVNEIEALTGKWKVALEEEISQRTSYFIGERQIDQVVENIQNLSVQSFQHTTSFNRFKSYLQSTKFLLKTIERQLNERV